MIVDSKSFHWVRLRSKLSPVTHGFASAASSIYISQWKIEESPKGNTPVSQHPQAEIYTVSGADAIPA